jgi:hypothetical protein
MYITQLKIYKSAKRTLANSSLPAVKKAVLPPSLAAVIGASPGPSGLFAGARRGRALGLLVALGFALLPALAPLSAHAQLRGLTGSVGGAGGVVNGLGGTIGGAGGTIGSPLPGSAPLGTPGLPSVDSALPPASDLLRPQLTRPIDTVTNTLNGTVTNTVKGTVANTLAVPGRAISRVGDAVNRGASRVLSGVPPVGERRFVPDEVMIRLPGNMPPQAVDELARRHGLARLESQTIALTGTTFHRFRIADRRAVPAVIAALEAECNRRGAAELPFHLGAGRRGSTGDRAVRAGQAQCAAGPSSRHR